MDEVTFNCDTEMVGTVRREDLEAYLRERLQCELTLSHLSIVDDRIRVEGQVSSERDHRAVLRLLEDNLGFCVESADIVEVEELQTEESNRARDRVFDRS